MAPLSVTNVSTSPISRVYFSQNTNRLAEVLKISRTFTNLLDLQQHIFDSLLKTFRQKDWTVLHQNSTQLDHFTDRWGKTLLMQAAIDWDQEIVHQLIQYKISIHDVDGVGNTALHHAVRSGALELIKSLTEHLSLQTKNKLGQTPFHVAIIAGQNEIVQYLLRKGANFKEGCPLSGSSYFISSLFLSVKEGQFGCFHALIEAKADFKEYTTGFGTILHIAVIYRQTEFLKKLFKVYPNEAKALLEIPEDQGLTPFNLAARHGDTDALTIFEEHGAMIETKDKSERGPLHQTVLGQYHLAVLWLVYLGCRLKVIDQNGDTPLSLAKKIAERDNTHTSYSIRNYLQNALGQEQLGILSDTKPLPLENLVLSGVGKTVQVYLGALQYLHDKDVLKGIKRVAATSFSSIIGTLIAVGCSVETIIEIIRSQEMTDLWNHPLQDTLLEHVTDSSIKALHQCYSYINKKISPRKIIQKLEDLDGICFLEKLREKIDQLIAAQVTKLTGADLASCTNLTFSELDLLVKASKAKALFIVATQAESDTESVIFSSEDPEWSDLVISDAIVASMAIPGVFKPHVLHFKDKHTSTRYPRGDKGLFIDGGISCHFPITLFDSTKYLSPQFVINPKSGVFQFNSQTVGLKIGSLKVDEKQAPITLKELLNTCSMLYYKALELLRKEELHNRVVELEDQYLSSSLEKSYDKAESVLKSKLFTNENYLLRDLLQFQNKISLPRSLDSFVGRVNFLKELKRICFTKEWRQASVCPFPHVYGFAGLGKSETSIMFANQHLDKFWFVWFIRCDNAFSYDESYRLLAERLKIPLDKETPEQIVEKVNMRLANSQEDKPWLLILDSVEAPVPMPERGGIVLTTSQHERIHKEATSPTPFPIEPFDFAETKEYFNGIPQEKLDRLESLHTELGGWPVLIAQARIYLEDTHCSVIEYLKELQSLDPLFKKEEHINYPKSLGQAFEMTLKRLSAKSKEAVEMLYTCAYLNNQEIQLELFKDWIKDRPVQWKKDVLWPLRDLSIIRFDEQKQSFSIQHKLWQEFLRKVLNRQGRAKEKIFEVADMLDKTARAFDFRDPKTWNNGKICAQHVEIDREMWIHSNSVKGSLLLTQTGSWLAHVKGNLFKSLQYFKKALEIRLEILGKEHLDTAISYTGVGLVLRDLGRHQEALEHHNNALKIRKKLLPREHHDIYASYNNIGLSLRDLKQHRKASKKLQKALLFFEKSYGINNQETLITYNNYGLNLRDLGQHQEALSCHEKTLTIRKKVLGEKHPDTAKSYYNKALSLYDLGRYQESLDCAKESLTIRKEMLGDEHRDTAKSYHTVGMCLRDTGQHYDALEYLQKALEIRKKILSDEHPDTVQTFHDIVGVVPHAITVKRSPIIADLD